MEYLMGVDLGSTSLKAIIYDLDGNAVASGSRPTERFSPPEHPEWVEWKPEQIWGGSAAAIQDAIAQIDSPKDIKGVAVTGMGMDGLPLDEEGNWLYPFISWLCPRTIPQQEWWKKNIGEEKVFSIGGNVLWGFSTALRLLWMREHHPDIMKRTHKWVLIEDFVNYMLCGKLATDYSMASCTLLFDQRTRDWSDELLQAAEIDRRLMCDAFPSGTLLGEVHDAAAKATGLAPGTPVALGGHDYLCGALPVGAFNPGAVLDITGTWEVVMTTLTEPVLTPEIQRAGMTVECHVARDMHAAWGGGVASDMLEWYRKEYGQPAAAKARELGGSDWDYLMAEAAAAPIGSHGAFFLPHMSGSGCPVVDPESKGAFIGLGNQVTRGDMLRAVIEGLDYQFLETVNAMESGLGITMDRFIAVGGSTRNAFWMQNKADVVGRPIEIPAVEEATPLGAAILAGIGVGLYANEQKACERTYKPGEILEPNPKRNAEYQKHFEVFRQIYPALKDLHHQIGCG